MSPHPCATKEPSPCVPVSPNPEDTEPRLRVEVSPCPLCPQDTGPAVTPGPALCAEARGAAQRLLDHYVQVQGAAVAQMLRKSVETRDWLGTVEPRNVRAVMKRVVEDITAIDVQVGAAPGPYRGLGWGLETRRGVPDVPEGSRGSLKGPEIMPAVLMKSLRILGCCRWSLWGSLKHPQGSQRVPGRVLESQRVPGRGAEVSEGSRGDSLRCPQGF